jgi:pimeloyl-ACP methyl ester carboxylesterase
MTRSENATEPTVSTDQAFFQITADLLRVYQAYWSGVVKYTNEFMLPFWIALNSFLTTEKDKIVRHYPIDTIKDYFELLQFNLQVAGKGFVSSLGMMSDYHTEKSTRAFDALLDTISGRNGNEFADFLAKEAALLENIVYKYPQAIRDIQSEYGFHFEDGGYLKAAETDRFILYQVLPRDSVSVRKDGKPILIIPPYVLGANILGFLPSEKKSYAHAYADQGIPTYIRIIKDIDTTPAVQTITGEDDALDIRYFCEQIIQKNGRKVTLNGFCQGGFVCLTALLSGKLDDLVDAFITCVAPMDGSRSEALIEYLQHLPPRFRDLGYAVKMLPNGNRIVDGKVMSWVYKLKSMEKEAPIYTFYRDLMLFSASAERGFNISKTAAAINHWLIYDRTDLPEAITKMSFDSYTIPVRSDGTLPIKLFGRDLSFARLRARKVPFLICYGKDDDLVDKAAALAPLDFVDAEVTCFPKGHGAIATSWSHPDSKYALHKRYPDGSRGPVRFQLDLSEATSKQS